MAVQVKSFNQLLGAMIRKFMSVTGVNDMHKGSAVLTLMEAAAQNDFEQSAALLQLLDDFSIDNATGADLDKRATEFGLLDGRRAATQATGFVTFEDSTITKVSTNIYVGANPPIAGDTVIRVNSVTGIAATDQVYIGRGTANLEGPFTVSSVTPGTAFSTITLSAPLTNNHALNETVILAQGGNRTISRGTKVQIPASNASPVVSFTTQADAVISDGESEVQNVLVLADKPGAGGNAALRAISQFSSPPFAGAVVYNPTAYRDARDAESDDELRDRIKDHVQSLSRGIPAAIRSAIIGLFDADDNKRVVSANLVQPTEIGEVGKLFVDDGTGFEPSFAGRGEEILIEDAAGTEALFQVGNYPITRPQLMTSLSQPFDFSVGGTLTLRVNGIPTEIELDPADFDLPDAATAIEVAEVINSKSSTISARTAEALTRVVIFPAAQADETIQVDAGGANDYLGFPTDEVHALKLYKNSVLLTKDGRTAFTESSDLDSWSGITDPSVITVNVNSKPTLWIRVGSSSLEVSFDGSSYVAVTNATSFLDLGVTITTASPTQWAQVLNQAVSGGTFTVDGDRLVLTSDTERSSESRVQIVSVADGGGNLATAQGWDTDVKIGSPSEYSLNRYSGQLELAEPLVEGDTLSAGSSNTRASVESEESATFDTSFGAGSRPAAIYVVVDGAATPRDLGIRPGVTEITVSNPAGTVRRYTDTSADAATDEVFENLEVGDYVVISRHIAANEGIFRVIDVDAGNTWFEIDNPVAHNATPTVLQEAFAILGFSSTVPPQKVTFSNSAAATPTSIATQINDQITGATAAADGDRVVITANRYATGGSIQVPASVEWASVDHLNFPTEIAEAQAPHVAALESASELSFPVAVGKGSITTADAVAPYITLTDTARTAGTPTPSSVSSPNQWVKFFDRTGADHDPGNNLGVRMFIKTQDLGTPTVLTLRDSVATVLGSSRIVAPDVLSPLNVGDLYAQFYPFDLGADDNLVVVVDDDEVAQTYNIPLARSGRCTSAGASSIITAADTDAATATTFASSVWNSHDFADYKVWFKAHKVVNPTGNKNAVIYRAVKYGPAGNKLRIGYDYPTAPSQAISSDVGYTADSTDVTVEVLVTFGSGAARAIASDATSQFDITAVGTAVTYTYDGTGTAPNFVANGVVVGDIATFDSANFDPANNGTYLITTVTPTAITVLNNKTTPVVESNKTLGVASALRIYPLASNTGVGVRDAVNNGTASSLVMEAVLTTLDPFGTANDGSGTIARSTLDDVAIASDYLTLVDGENWVDTFDSPGPPSFTLKRAISERQVNDGGVIYDFGTAPNFGTVDTGERFKLIPVHAKNVADHLNKKAISGLSLTANVQRSRDAQRVQIASLNVGSAGSVHVTGGSANGVTAAALKVAATESVWTRMTLATSGAAGFWPGLVVKLRNAEVTKEINTFISTTVVAATVPGGTNPYRRLTLSDRASLDVNGDTFDVTANADGTATYTRTAGAGDLSLAQAGDEIVIPAGSAFAAANEGTFIVVSSTSSTIVVINPEAANEVGVVMTGEHIVAKTPFFLHPNIKATGAQVMVVEKLNDRFARFRYLSGGTAPLFSTRGVKPGYWVDVASGSSAGFDSRNVGRFRVIAVDTTSFIVENEDAIDDGPVTLVADPIGSGDFLGEITTTVSGAGGLLQFWGPNSAMSSDEVSVEALTDPTWFPAPWQGRFEVVGHGRDSSTGQHFVYVDNPDTVLTPSITLGTNSASFLVLEGEPYETYRLVENATPNPDDEEETFVWISGTDDSDRFSDPNGTQLVAQNKLGYSTTEKVGVDGYQYWTGLLRRVHRVMDGYDPDQVNFPGVKAAGVQIEALPPEVRQVSVSINVRPVTGLSVNSISQAIKSAVLSYINSLGVGDDVITSEIVARVQAVAGVQSVILLDPTPDTERVIIQDNEKAIAFEADVTVT